jgi:hypothetical protein
MTEDEVAARALEEAARRTEETPRGRWPAAWAHRLTTIGLTLLWLALTLLALFAPILPEIDVLAALRQGWLAVLLALVFVSWILTRRPTRATGAVLIVGSILLLVGLFVGLRLFCLAWTAPRGGCCG